MQIQTLVRDIYATVKDNWFRDAYLADFNTHLSQALNQSERIPELRLSKMGEQCPSALWHSIHSAEHAQSPEPWAFIKFTYGHILEALVIQMAKAAGHEVTGEQDEIVVDGVKGHRDCVIDGCVVDVKSCSSRMFEKFKSKSIQQDDPFGYLDQLDGYLVGSSEDSLVRTKDRGYILAVDKTLGHLSLYEHRIREDNIKKRIILHKSVVGRDQAPNCTCETVSEGKSGNVKLGVKASYSAYKYLCFPHLRTFLYASGPVYLTKVVRKPDVTEIDKTGKIVYNG